MNPNQRTQRQELRDACARLGIPFIETMADFTRPTNAARRASGPAPQLEPMASPWSDVGPTVTVDRYSLNPAVDWVRAVAPNAGTGLPPTMFNTGDLPLFTSSGIDPSQLAYVPWRFRHWAALTPRREPVLRLVENTGSTYPDIYPDTSSGDDGYRDYLQRVFDWATSNAEEDRGGGGYDLVSALLYGPGQ